MGSSSLRWRPLFYLVCLTVFWLGTLDADRYEAVYLPTGVVIRHSAASCVVCAREERLPFLLCKAMFGLRLLRSAGCGCRSWHCSHFGIRSGPPVVKMR